VKITDAELGLRVIRGGPGFSSPARRWTMSSLVLEPRPSRPASVRPTDVARGVLHESSGRAAAGPARSGVRDFLRITAGTMAVTASLIAFPILMLVPLVLTGLFLGLFAALFGGMA
jgi:hypothetical protein